MEEVTQEAEETIEEITQPAEEAEATPEEAGAEQPSEEPATGEDQAGDEGAGEDGTGLGGGMLAASPFETDGVSQYGIAYQTPQFRQIVVPKKDYVAELDALIERSLFGRMI